MKTLLPTILAVALLGGCAGTPAVTTAPSGTAATTTIAPPTPALPSISALTSADIAASIAEANAATPPDTQWSNCMTYVQANLGAIQGNVINGPLPVGVLSAAEKARLGLLGLNSTLSPVSKTAFENACGPLVMDTQNQALSLANELAALMGAVAIKGGALAALP